MTTYVLECNNPWGRRLRTINTFTRLEYVRAENEIGSWSLVAPDIYPGNTWQWHNTVEVWRQPEGLPMPYLDTDTVWLQENWDFTEGIDAQVTTTGSCLNKLLKFRWVDYNEGTIYTQWLGPADDFMKRIMRQNYGSAALDTTRDISGVLSVQADFGAAPVAVKFFHNRNVFDVLKELAALSAQRGTYLIFDVFWTGGAIPYEFRTFIGQREIDRRAATLVTPALIFSSGLGNITDVHVVESRTEAVSRTIAGGQGIGTAMAKQRANNANMQNESPLGLIEYYQQATTEGDSQALLDDADGMLNERRPRKVMTAKIQTTPGFVYGIHWKFGSRGTAEVRGQTFDCRVTKVHVVVEQGGETIEGLIQGELYE